MNPAQDKIEILSIELLDHHRGVVQALNQLSRQVSVELGWHYLLDLTWILENLGDPRGLHILDGGAGFGLLQWYLVEHGAARLVSVDREDRANLGLRFRARYHVSGMQPSDLLSSAEMLRRNVRSARGAHKLLAAGRGAMGVLLGILPKAYPGRVILHRCDLAHLDVIPDNSLDAAVAVSALEHNTPENLPVVVQEIMRKVKPGGKLLATLGAAKEKDWFHEPSRGWNYTDATLRRIFDLAPDASSNYARHDELLGSLRTCAELRDHLASFYSKSGDNGMPWGKWDPQYQPVGVCKVKPGK